MNATGTMKGTTLSDRIRATANSVERLDRYSATYERKTAVVRGKMLPKELYGCEISPINETAMRSLRTAIVNCITFVTSRRSIDLTFAMASIGTDVDPDVVVVCRRTTALRRALTINVENASMIEDIIGAYTEKKKPGIF